MEHKSDGDTNYIWCTLNNPQTVVKRTGRRGNKNTIGDHLEYSIIRIGQDTEESPRHLKDLMSLKRKWKKKTSTFAGFKN